MNGTATAAEPSSKPWAVFPCHFIRGGRCSCGKACNSPGKHPLTANGLLNATTNQKQLDRWWKANPQANVGLATGEVNQLVVIDVDPAKGGTESLLEIEEQYGRPPETVEVETGGGGLHLYYRYPADVKIHSRNGWRPGVDIKADGGYVIAPPSNHISGNQYHWAEGRQPGDIEIADIPPWLLALLPQKNEATNGRPANGSHVFTFANGGASVLERAKAYADKAEPASEGVRNDTAFRLAGHLAALDDNGDRLSEPDIFETVSTWNSRNLPPLSDSELWQCVKSALVNGTPRPTKGSTGSQQSGGEPPPIDKFKFGQLRRLYPKMRQPIIEGLLRQGETCNVVSVSKIGKSWLGYGLALSVIAGHDWFGRFATAPGEVLLIDNELHRETVTNRLPAVAKELGVSQRQLDEALEVWPLRGRRLSLAAMLPHFAAITPRAFKVIILDAKYRFIEDRASENDNAAEARFYNLVDEIAEHTQSAIVLIHHSSKGGQADKRVTDVGAGAGAQSRAADTHIVLREHEDPDVAVLDAAVRSFAPIEPLALRWEFPLWTPDGGIDPAKLKGRLSASDQRQQAKDREAIQAIVDALCKASATASQLRDRTGFSRDRLLRLLGRLQADGQVTASTIVIRGNNCHEFHLAR